MVLRTDVPAISNLDERIGDEDGFNDGNDDLVDRSSHRDLAMLDQLQAAMASQQKARELFWRSVRMRISDRYTAMTALERTTKWLVS